MVGFAAMVKDVLRDLSLLYRSTIPERLHLRSLGGVSQYFSGVLLDVGCDSKPWQTYFGHLVKKWIGLDLPLYVGEKTKADVFGDAMAIPLKGASVDTILCTQTLDNVKEPSGFFWEAMRVLKASGTLILTAPQYNPTYNEPNNFWRFTRYGLELLASESGFRVRHVEALGGAGVVLAAFLSNHVPGVMGNGRVVRAAMALLEFGLLRLDRHRHRVRDSLGWLMICSKEPSRYDADRSV